MLAVQRASSLSSKRDNAVFVGECKVAQIAAAAHAGVNGQLWLCGVSTSYMLCAGEESCARGGLKRAGATSGRAREVDACLNFEAARSRNIVESGGSHSPFTASAFLE